MQTKQLPADVARCYGFQCQTREQCLRYLEREHYQSNTIFVVHFCKGEGLEHYIPAKEQT